MTVDQVVARVAEIQQMSDDDENAHSSEDELWEDVLRAIADGASQPASLAAVALRTKGISFARWHA
jgi:hypothetical protein